MTGAFEPIRLGWSLVAGLALAAGAGLHIASAIATRTAPDLAADLFFANAEARERMAFRGFTQKVSDPASLTSAAASVRALSLAALRVDPTSAKALALLALAKDDLASRHSAAIAASRINRRDLTLQGLTLEAHLAANDYDGAVETLDQILRVHPAYLGDFAPVLVEALREDETVPVFARLLDGSSPWHKYFYSQYALGDVSLLPNLALLRAQRPLADEVFDRDLIRRLVEEGHTAEARALFDRLTGGREGSGADADTTGRVLGWDARFPPFDWRFVDNGDFRAQASLAGDELEIFVRPGRGGAIAERVLETPPGPFALKTRLEIEGTHRSEAVRAELSCEPGGSPFARQDLTAGKNTIRVDTPPSCEEFVLAIHARAWSGSSALRARLGQISLVPSR